MRSGLIAEGVETGQANLAPFEAGADPVPPAALAKAAAGRPEPLSWQRLLAGPVADLGGRFHFVLVKPVQDYGALEPGAAAAEAIRSIAAGLEFVRAGRAHVRLTGSVALEDEEFSTVAEGAVGGLLGSMLLLAVLLRLAVGGWRLVAPVLLTLVLGLLLTTGFAALAVGTLNLVSIAFAVLFVGIAVDFRHPGHRALPRIAGDASPIRRGGAGPHRPPCRRPGAGRLAWPAWPASSPSPRPASPAWRSSA